MDIKCKKCGTENFYFEEKKGPHVTAVCSSCGSYIKHLPKNKPFIIPFGKYIGRELSSMTSSEEISYLTWLSSGDINDNFKNKILAHLKGK